MKQTYLGATSVVRTNEYDLGATSVVRTNEYDVETIPRIKSINLFYKPDIQTFSI